MLSVQSSQTHLVKLYSVGDFCSLRDFCREGLCYGEARKRNPTERKIKINEQLITTEMSEQVNNLEQT